MMRWGKSSLLKALIVAVVVAALPFRDLSACSCITIPVRTRFMGATHVFAGTFTSVAIGSHGWPDRATVRVSEWFLGPRAPEVTFQIAGGCSTSQSAVGNSALIFAILGRDGTLLERGCASVALKDPRSGPELSELRRKAWLWRLQRRIVPGEPVAP